MSEIDAITKRMRQEGEQRAAAFALALLDEDSTPMGMLRLFAAGQDLVASALAITAYAKKDDAVCVGIDPNQIGADVYALAQHKLDAMRGQAQQDAEVGRG